MRLNREQLIAKAMTEAIETLNQIGCSYSITDPSGAVFTNIIQAKKRNNFRGLHIPSRLLNSTIGEEIFFECPEDSDLSGLQGSIIGHAGFVFGSSNYTTKIDRARNGVTITCGRKKGVSLADVFATPATATEAAHV